MNVSTAIIQDTRRQKKDGSFPVKLRVTHNREQRYFRTKYNLTREDFDRVKGSKPRNEYKDIALELNSLEKKCKDILDQLEFFSWELLEKRLKTNTGFKSSLYEWFTATAQKYRDQDQIGTAVNYECARASFAAFSADARLSDVTKQFLTEYESRILGEGKSVTTVSMYTRALRAIFNQAIADGAISPDAYPFGRKKYTIPESRNIKKAITKEHVAKIFAYTAAPGSTEATVLDYWKFLYLCNGINVKDMCLLRFKNVKSDHLEFTRAKTIRTKRTVEAIRVPLTPLLLSIIERQGTKQKKAEDFIFPVLKPNLTAVRERQLIQQITHVMNDHMKNVQVKLNIPLPLTTYVARHSFATMLMRGGMSIEFISGAMGHANIRTTQNYLAGFENDTLEKAASILTDFNLSESA